MMRKISQRLDEQSIELLARHSHQSGEFVPRPQCRSDAPHRARRRPRSARCHDGMMNRVISPPRPIHGGRRVGSTCRLHGRKANNGRPPAGARRRHELRHLVSICATRCRSDIAVDDLVGGRHLESDGTSSQDVQRCAAFEGAPGNQMGRPVSAADGLRARRDTAPQPVTVQERFKRRTPSRSMLATYRHYVQHGGSWFFASRRLEVVERG